GAEHLSGSHAAGSSTREAASGVGGCGLDGGRAPGLEPGLWGAGLVGWVGRRRGATAARDREGAAEPHVGVEAGEAQGDDVVGLASRREPGLAQTLVLKDLAPLAGAEVGGPLRRDRGDDDPCAGLGAVGAGEDATV